MRQGRRWSPAARVLLLAIAYFPRRGVFKLKTLNHQPKSTHRYLALHHSPISHLHLPPPPSLSPHHTHTTTHFPPHTPTHFPSHHPTHQPTHQCTHRCLLTTHHPTLHHRAARCLGSSGCSVEGARPGGQSPQIRRMHILRKP